MYLFVLAVHPIDRHSGIAGRNEVGTRHPTDRLRVLLLCSGELRGDEAGDRFADVLPSRYDQCENDQNQCGEGMTESIGEIIISSELASIEFEFSEAGEEMCIHRVQLEWLRKILY